MSVALIVCLLISLVVLIATVVLIYFCWKKYKTRSYDEFNDGEESGTRQPDTQPPPGLSHTQSPPGFSDTQPPPGFSSAQPPQSSSRSIKAPELVQQGNQLKLHQNWLEAGQKFEAAAEQFSKRRRGEHDAANNYSEAANCYRKLPEKRAEAVRCLQLAAEIYAEQGQFSIAARHLEEAGDLSRSLGDEASVSRAIELFQRAADYFSGEDSPANSAGSRAKAAELMADCGRLREAAQLFEDLGESADSHSLLGFGAKDHLAKCCLCLLCSDAAGVGEKAEQLVGLCGSFKDSDELSLVRSLAAAAEARDVGALDTAVTEFERFNNVDDFGRRRLDQLREILAGGSEQLR